MAKTKIIYYDCADDMDMDKAEQILATKEIIKQEVVNFPHLMIEYTE